jgi:formimidoylglutamate deiminase
MTVLSAKTALLPHGWTRDVVVEIEGGRIARIAEGLPNDRAVGCLLPAPVNLHSHAFQRAMAGMTERRSAGQDSFWTWRDLMYRFLDRLTPEDVEAIAAFVQMEMAEAGYAAVAEFHYLHHGVGGSAYADRAEMSARIAAGAAESGLGLTLLPVLYAQGGCDGRALTAGQRRFGNDMEGYLRLWEGAARALAHLPDDTVLGVAPHSLRAVSRSQLVEAVAIAPDAPLHIHLAEQVAEVREVEAAYGARPVDWLLANHAVDGRWCPIHCTQMEPGETLALAATGAVAGLCPITEANLGDGIFDGVRYAGAGGRWGVGSDSNVRIALSEELRLLEYSQRFRDRGRAMLATEEKSTGRMLYESVVAGGAQAGGRASGAIRVGDWADLVALDMAAVDLEGRAGDAILDAWIFAGDDRMVADVWSAGRHIVSGGAHVRKGAITQAYRRVMAGLRDAL